MVWCVCHVIIDCYVLCIYSSVSIVMALAALNVLLHPFLQFFEWYQASLFYCPEASFLVYFVILMVYVGHLSSFEKYCGTIEWD